MRSNRLEAFSDGVLAIVITIMVLELHAPEGHDLADLADSLPGLATYLLSFVYVGIYWSNHHHMFQLCSPRQRRRAVGEPRAALHAVAVPVHHRVDGRVRVRPRPGHRLRR